MLESLGENLPLATSKISGVLEYASILQDNQDRAFRVASSLGADLSLDEPLLDSSDLWLIRPAFLAAPAYHAPAARS